MATIGEPIAAALTSWAGTADTTSLPYYLATYQKFKGIVWTAKGVAFDSSTFGGTAGVNFETRAASLLGIDFSLEAHLKTPQDGYLGLVTFSGGEVLNLNGWEMTIVRKLHDVTPFGNQYRVYSPGLVATTGSISGFIDGTTAMKRPLLAAGWGSATFQVLSDADDAGGTGKQLVASINYTESKATLTRGGPASKAYNFEASGAVTTVGNSTNMLWAADTDGTMLSHLNTTNPPTLVLTTNGSLALSGVAFWRSINIVNRVGQPVMVKVEGSFSDVPTGLTAMGS